MRASLKWLSEYVDLPKVPLEALAERLTVAGLEVERVETLSLEGVVVARVEGVEPHPKANSLRVCTVGTGSGTRIVVCGAENVVAGGLVPLALPGARLPGGTLSEATIRGVRSKGMILSRQELGLEAKSPGIWNLPDGLPLGADLGPLLELPDTVLTLQITSNRPDLLGIVGIAREISALYRTAFREPDLGFPETGPEAKAVTAVEVEDPADCPRYVARVLRGADGRPSPLPIQARLLKGGMRPLSLVVDGTNYVLLELGHPLHAFDHARLGEGRIVVRRARAGERIRTLDGVERELSPEVLVIADARRPVAVAGVMGGAETEIDLGTRDVLLEAAAFSPARVRRGSRLLGLRTEASLRFERGLSPEMADVASRRLCAVLARHDQVQILRGSVDAYPAPARPRRVVLRKGRIAEILGVEVPPGEVEEGLGRLGVQLQDRGEAWEADVPPFRGDLLREIDLIEEVARLHGYDRIPAQAPHVAPRVGGKDPREAFADRVREVLASLGLLEVCTPGLVPAGEAEVLVRNPLAQGAEGLRSSLLPGLLGAVRLNLEAGAPGVALFEVGRVFLRRNGELVEEDRAAVALAGRPAIPLAGKGEYTPAELKGLLDGLLSALGVEEVSLGEASDPRLHPYRRATVYGPRGRIGWLGELAPSLTADLPGGRRVLAFELSLPLLRELVRPAEHRPLPRAPASKRDLSLLVPAALPAGKVTEAILAEPLVEGAFLYDRYEGAGLPAGHVSLTYEVAFRDPERTLLSGEVDGAVERILGRLATLGVRIRS